MKPWIVVMLKELKDAGRDRRALGGLLLFPIMGPLIIYFMLNTIIEIGEESLDISLPVVGLENAPGLIDYLQQNGIEVTGIEIDLATDSEDDGITFSNFITSQVRDKIEQREYDYVLIIPDDFSERVANSETVNVEVHHDSSRTTIGPQVGRVQSVVNAWGRETAALRLLIRGINNSIINPVAVNLIDIATPQARAQQIIAMIPLFAIMAAFMGGVGIAVDATAGERERKSLEPLLVNPVPRSNIVIGKWLAAIVFSVIGLTLVMVLNQVALSNVPLEEMGFSFNLGVVEITGMLLATIPLVFFATSMQIFVGIFAKSFKDAQAYISLMAMLPMLPYFYIAFNNTGRETWMNFVPLLGQNMLLNDIISGKPPSMLDYVLSAGTLGIIAVVFIALTTQLLKREKIIFS